MDIETIIVILGIVCLVGGGTFWAISNDIKEEKLYKETGECQYADFPDKCKCEKLGGIFYGGGFGTSNCVFPPK